MIINNYYQLLYCQSYIESSGYVPVPFNFMEQSQEPA
jgi:hypothetical protein